MAKVVAALGGDLSRSKNVSSNMAQLPLPNTERLSASLPQSFIDGALSATFTEGVARSWMEWRANSCSAT